MYLYILWKALDQEMCIQSKCSEQADFPTYLSPCVCVPLCTRFTQTGYVVSVFTYDMQEGGKYAFHAIRLKLAFSKMSYCTFNVHDCQYCLEIVYIPLVGHDLWTLTFYRERCCTGCDGGTIHRTMTPGSLRHTWMTAGRCCLCTRRSWLRWSQRRKLAWWDCLDVCSHNCSFSKSLIYRY